MASIEVEIDHYLQDASTKALLAELEHRRVYGRDPDRIGESALVQALERLDEAWRMRDVTLFRLAMDALREMERSV